MANKFTQNKFNQLSEEQKVQMLILLLNYLPLEVVVEQLKQRYSKSEIDELIIGIDEITLGDFCI